MKQDVFEIGKQCLNMIERIVYAYRRQDVVTGVNESSRLILSLTNFLREYAAWQNETKPMDQNAFAYVESMMAEICQAQEEEDMILFSDLLELKLKPMLYEVQAALLGQGISYVSFDIFKKNMILFRKKAPLLTEQLKLNVSGIDDDREMKMLFDELRERYVASGRLEPSSAGWPTFAFSDEGGRYYAHSNVNPVWEGYMQAEQYYHMDKEMYLCYGLGLGYLPLGLLAHNPDMDLTIYETDADVLRMALLCTDLQALLNRKRVRLVFDPELKKLASDTGDERVFVLHEPSMRHLENAKIRESLRAIFLRDANQRYCENGLHINFRRNIVNCDNYVDCLRPLFEHKHAVIVAAGPSLDKNVEQLRRLPEGTLIIATGTIFKKLKHLGIQPDYVVFSDPKEALFVQIEGMLKETVPLLILSTTYYRIAREYAGKKYLVCQKGIELSQNYAREHGYEIYETGGSVSTTALDICIRLGCSEIAFVGLDLSYSNHSSHAGDTGKNLGQHMEMLRPAKGVDGSTVYVCNSFNQYRKWIERRIADLKNTSCKTVIDATEGGVVKQGMPVMTLDEVILRWTK